MYLQWWLSSGRGGWGFRWYRTMKLRFCENTVCVTMEQNHQGTHKDTASHLFLSSKSRGEPRERERERTRWINPDRAVCLRCLLLFFCGSHFSLVLLLNTKRGPYVLVTNRRGKNPNRHIIPLANVAFVWPFYGMQKILWHIGVKFGPACISPHFGNRWLCISPRFIPQFDVLNDL